MNGQPGKLVRVYVNEDDRYGGKPLYEAIVDRCRELKVAGATVFRAFEGFGETAELHHQHLFRSDLPIVITIVERPEKVDQTEKRLSIRLSKPSSDPYETHATQETGRRPERQV